MRNNTILEERRMIHLEDAVRFVKKEYPQETRNQSIERLQAMCPESHWQVEQAYDEVELEDHDFHEMEDQHIKYGNR